MNNTTSSSSKTSHIKLSKQDLPAHCPLPDSPLWNSHPKVYLPIVENGGKTKCPYCGTEYTLS